MIAQARALPRHGHVEEKVCWQLEKIQMLEYRGFLDTVHLWLKGGSLAPQAFLLLWTQPLLTVSTTGSYRWRLLVLSFSLNLGDPPGSTVHNSKRVRFKFKCMQDSSDINIGSSCMNCLSAKLHST